MQDEEIAISLEAPEQPKELSIHRQRFTKWTALVQVVPAYALKREVESIRYLRVESTGTIDSLLSVDSISRENHHAADGVADPPEGFVVFRRDQCCDVSEASPLCEGWNDRVTAQEELA